jgi:RND family efflux transporter MFP subunit
MKKTFLIIILGMTLLISACGGSSPPESIPTVVLDSGSTSSNAPVTTSKGTVIASAEIRPVDSVNLSFPLLGTVKTVDVQVGDSVSAGQVLTTLDTAILEARVAEAEANVLAAETQVRYQRRVNSSQEQIDSAQADVDRANAALDQAKATLAQATMTSPISGTVVAVDTAPGETANPGQAVIVIADLSRMHIETTDLSERDIPAVQIGQQASVFIDALGESYEGEVVDIARQSETVGGDVVYEVTIEFTDQPAGLRWGMSAEVEIQTEQ